MFGFSNKLEKWQEAGLITSAQAADILTHEKNRKSGRFGRGLIGVAIFAIVIGVLSIVAANWHSISGEIKIAAHVLVNLALAAAVYLKRDIWREAAVLLLFGLTLTLIALIGQVYQLGGSWGGALTLWMVATLPLIGVYASGRITGWPWMLAFLATIIVVIGENIDRLPEFWGSYFVMVVGLFLPLALIADGSLTIFQKWKPAYAKILSQTGFFLAIVSASTISVLWYFGSRESLYLNVGQSIGFSSATVHFYFIGLFALAVLAQFIYAALYKFYQGDPNRKNLAILVFGATFSTALPYIIIGFGSNIVAALHLIIFWLFAGWIGQLLGWQRFVTLAIIIITLRIFAIYIELFGGLLSTGIGLISGGIILLTLIWGAKKLNTRLKIGVKNA